MRRRVGLVALLMWGCVASEAPESGLAGPVERAPIRDVAPTDRVAVSGGSLLVTADGAYAVLGDPDTDRVLVIDLETNDVAMSVALDYGSEPGRIVQDGAGRVHVVLRRSGHVLTLDLRSGAHRERAVCTSPRGIAWRESDDTLLVACAEGVLVTLPAGAGAVLDRVEIEDDLRDVVVVDDQVLVSRFRAAEVLALDANGAIAHRWRPAIRVLEVAGAAPDAPVQPVLEPQVAWRLVAARGTVWLLHQYARVTPVALVRSTVPSEPPPQGEYGGDLGGRAGGGDPSARLLVRSALSRVDLGAPDGALAPAMFLPLALANDLSVAPDGDSMAISSPVEGVTASVLLFHSVPCQECVSFQPVVSNATSAVAFATSGLVLAVEHAPLALVRWTTEYHHLTRVAIDPAGAPVSPGASLFYTVTGSGLACASCHPEGGDDGHLWTLGDVRVRTQSLRGHVLSTAPFHWEGDLANFDAVIDEVWTRRMGGFELTSEQRAALARWVGSLDALPAVPGAPDAVARGAVLFASPEVGCTTCHSGAMRSDDRSIDIGTGAAWQVPQLVSLSYRAPFMHDGCAETLRDRFVGEESCTGGDRHGHTSQLSRDQIDDLVAYLRSL